MVQIADRLCCAFGQDVLDTLFSRETLATFAMKPGLRPRRQEARPLFYFMLSLGYVRKFSLTYLETLQAVVVHTLVFFYMLVSLNVAINSYDYTLLSLLVSNQFVEIKGCEISFSM